ILNDNDMSIAPPVGSLRNSLARLVSSGKYLTPRKLAQKLARAMPEPLHRIAGRMEEYARGLFTGGTLFDELGFYYVGPVDGHDVRALVEVLENVRDAEVGPMLVHVVTKKGKGYEPAENAADKYHGVVKFDVVSGVQAKAAGGAPSYTSVYAKALSTEMARDEKVVAITAAMPSGTGLDKVAEQFPERTFDVGIAEQHAVTFAGGLAAQGYKPFCAIYSTFLQRAYDQVVHDIAIQNLPVRFAMDRAGLVRADGATHAGSFDLAYPCPLPKSPRLAEAEKAADQLDAKGLSTTVADLRFAKPLDSELTRKLLTTHEVAVTIEEAAIGGVGAHVLTLASDEGLVDAGLKIRTMRLPDRFQDQEKPEKQYDEAHLNAPHIVETVLRALRINSAGMEEVRA